MISKSILLNIVSHLFDSFMASGPHLACVCISHANIVYTKLGKYLWMKSSLHSGTAGQGTEQLHGLWVSREVPPEKMVRFGNGCQCLKVNKFTHVLPDFQITSLPAHHAYLLLPSLLGLRWCLPMQPTLNLSPSCLSISCVGITGVWYHTWLR